jgi:hypothetical protein
VPADSRAIYSEREPIIRPTPPRGSADHDEALLDDSIMATFPASDPPATTQPGSTLNRTHQSKNADAQKSEPVRSHPVTRGIEPEGDVGVSAEEAQGWGPNRSVNDR